MIRVNDVEDGEDDEDDEHDDDDDDVDEDGQVDEDDHVDWQCAPEGSKAEGCGHLCET